MVKNKKRLFSLALAGMMLGSTFQSTIVAIASGMEAQVTAKTSNVVYSEEVQEKLAEVTSRVDEALKSKSLDKMKEAIELFIEMNPILTEDERNTYEEKDAVYKAYEKIRSALYSGLSSVNIKERANMVAHLHNRLLTTIVMDMPDPYKYFFIDIYENNIGAFSSIDNTLTRNYTNWNSYLTEQRKDENFKDSLKIDDNGYLVFPKIEITAPVENEEQHEESNLVNKGIEDKANEEKQKENSDKKADPVISSSINYETRGSSCFKVETIYEDGVKSKVNRTLAPKSDYVYCGIYDYVDTGNTSTTGGISENEDTEDMYKDTQNVESNLTLHYTVEKGEENPFYYDSGIRTTLDGISTYEQLRDVLYQMALKGKSFTSEDKDKFMVVIEGKPYILYQEKEEYTKSEVEEMFKGTENFDVRVFETKIGTSTSLEQSLVSKQITSIIFKDQDNALRKSPILKDERVLLSIEEIGTILGAEVTKTENKLVIKKDNNEIAYEEGSDIVVVNGASISMKVATMMEDDVLMGEVTEMISVLGYELHYDSEDGTLNIN